jgi:hypothetical protein
MTARNGVQLLATVSLTVTDTTKPGQATLTVSNNNLLVRLFAIGLIDSYLLTRHILYLENSRQHGSFRTMEKPIAQVPTK